MTRFQELEAMLEVSTIIARMSNSSADEVSGKLTQLSKEQFREEAYQAFQKPHQRRSWTFLLL
jgi:hypothetical protein